jgi:large subunit ribosomal protein L10
MNRGPLAFDAEGDFFYGPEAANTHQFGKEDLLMPTPRKETIVESLTAKLRRAKALVLMQTQGLTVADQTDLRKKLRSGGMEFQVVKNTLFRTATRAADVANVDDILNGPTAVAIGYEDEMAVAKAVTEYVRTSKIVTIKGGMLGRQKLDAAQMDSLAKLPGRNDLRAQAVGTVQGPLSQTNSLISAPLRDLVQILHNYSEKQGATF